jgi:hypothetical protein
MSAVDAVAGTGSTTVRYPLPQQGAGSSGYAATAAGMPPARGVPGAPGDERPLPAGAPGQASPASAGAAAKRPAPAVPAPSVEMTVQQRADGGEAVVLVDKLSGKEVFALPPEQVSRAVDAALQRRRLGLHATADAVGAPIASGSADQASAAEPAARTRGARRGDQ